MNLGIISKSLSHHGGAEIYLMECMRRWQYQADITLYSTAINADMLQEFGIDTDRVEQVLLSEIEGEERQFDLVEDTLILPRMWEFSIRRHDAYFLNGGPAHLVRCSPSVYMCHEPLRMLYDLRYQYAVDEGAAAVHIYPEQKYRQVVVRTLEIQLELIESLDRRAGFDRMAVNSQAMSRYAENVYGKPADLVAYPGVNPRDSVTPPGSGKRAVYVGRLWYHKRIHLLIKAIARLEEGYLDIVGQGPELANLQALAEELDVADRVVFHGALPAEEVAKIYEASTCGAYVPLREPFGMMPLEAAAAGRPVIIAPEGGYTEILDDEAAFIVAPTPKAIARAMQKLFDNEKLAGRKGARARQCVNERTWDKTAAELFGLFEDTARRESEVTGLGGRPQIGAHYYPWYDAGRPLRHWNENTDHAAVSDLPLRGAYTSYELKTVQRHVDLAIGAGLDFLTIDWEIGHTGLNKKDLEATRLMFEEAEKRGSRLKLNIMLSIHTSILEPVQTALQYIVDFAASPVWQKVRGRPVLWFFISADFLGFFFAHKHELAQMCGEFAIMTTGAVTAPHHLPVDIQEFIHGWSLYVPFKIGNTANWEEQWLAAYRHHISDPDNPVRIFTVSPGYNDAHLTAPARMSSETRKVPREEGKTYQRMLSMAADLNPAPEIIMITSFNEYHENTHIEPSFDHGGHYLEQTAAFTGSIKRKYADHTT